MKNTFKYLLCAGVAFVLAACAPNELSKPDMGSLPNISSIQYTVEQGDEPYRYIFDVKTPGVVGIWDFGESGGVVTGNHVVMDMPFSGAQTASLKVYGKGGVSADSVEIPFTVEQGNLSIPGTPGYFLTQLGAWVWDKDTQGHIGNGASNATAPQWWNAGANELKDAGCYDDIMHFYDTGAYLLEAHGDVAVNERAAIEYAHVSEAPGGTTKYPYVEPTAPQRWSLSGTSLKITNGGFPSYVLPEWATLTYTVLVLNETTLQICAPNTKDGNNRFFFRFIHPAE